MMIRLNTFFLIFLLIISPHSILEAKQVDTYWPIPKWKVRYANHLLESNQCERFKKFAVNSKSFLTEGLIVIKNGVIQYEYYDSKYGPNRSHVLWSVSKSITATLLGMAIRDDLVSLDLPLSQFYPNQNHNENYQKIKIQNLLYLDTGFEWDEDTTDLEVNGVINMLFGIGKKDMASFSASKNIIAEGPSFKWNYSTGTPTITMGVLKKIYGEKYNEMPWTNLFNPLGIKSASFEKDQSGTFLGGSGAFATPRDMAKLGLLYLNNGIWNGDVLIPASWMDLIKAPSPGYLSPGTIVNDITKTGVYGGSFWLNKAVKGNLGKPYPHVPDDMFMALGLYGQFIIMLPSQNMVIVRTGHDNSYHHKIDEFISSAIACFDDPNYSVADTDPNPGTSVNSLSSQIKNVKNALEARIIQGGVAKTICSCHYVSGLDIPTCIKRNNLSVTKLLTKVTVRENRELNNNFSIQVRLARFARLFKVGFEHSAKAVYDPNKAKFGCTLE